MEAILEADRAHAEQVAEQRRLTGVIALPDGTRVKRSASVFEPAAGDSKSHPNPDQTPAALAAATANAQAKEAARFRSLAHGGQDPGEGGCVLARVDLFSLIFYFSVSVKLVLGFVWS